MVQQHWLLFQRTCIQFLVSTRQFTTVSNSSFREPDSFFSPWVPNTHRCIHNTRSQNTHTNFLMKKKKHIYLKAADDVSYEWAGCLPHPQQCTMIGNDLHPSTYTILMSRDVFGFSENGRQSSTWNPQPWQLYPLIFSDVTVTGRGPIFSTLKFFVMDKSCLLSFGSSKEQVVLFSIHKFQN